MKVSFAMRSFDMAEAFRRAAVRYQDDRGWDESKEPVPKFTVKLVAVECRHNSWEEGPFFNWEFEGSETHQSDKR